MPPVRPLPLPDTASKAGYDHVDPFTQWMNGGSTAPGARATGISDDDNYGLDLQNSGVGGLSFRAFSGNGTHFGRINNSGVAFGGTFSVTGSASISGSLTVANLTVTTGATIGNGLTVTTGATVLGGALTVTGAATMGSALTVLGAATVGSLRSTGAATIAGIFVAAGLSSFLTSVEMVTTLSVSAGTSLLSTLAVSGAVTMSSTLQVNGTVTTLSPATVGSYLAVTGQMISNVPDGTAPMVVTSTTLVANLNVQKLNGLASTDFVSNNSYTGNGSAARLINLGWQPQCVVITTDGPAGTTGQMGVLLSTATNTTIFVAKTGATTAGIGASEITRLTSPGFIVDAAGINPFGNVSGVTYRYAAWRTS